MDRMDDLKDPIFLLATGRDGTRLYIEPGQGPGLWRAQITGVKIEGDDWAFAREGHSIEQAVLNALTLERLKKESRYYLRCEDRKRAFLGAGPDEPMSPY
jgi:hypothetical protein